MSWVAVIADVVVAEKQPSTDERKCRGACGKIKNLEEFYSCERKLRAGGKVHRYGYRCIQCILQERVDQRQSKGSKPMLNLRTVLK